MLTQYKQIERMARAEFPDIVISSRIFHKRASALTKLRLHLKDQTYMDIWFSETGKYSYHWEQRAKRGLIHRHDNAPDHPEIATFPKHFHNGDEQTIVPSYVSDNPLEAMREFLYFARERLKETNKPNIS